MKTSNKIEQLTNNEFEIFKNLYIDSLTPKSRLTYFKHFDGQLITGVKNPNDEIAKKFLKEEITVNYLPNVFQIDMLLTPDEELNKLINKAKKLAKKESGA